MLHLNEIKTRAMDFSKEWENETSENAEGKTFLDEFFNVFGIKRRRVASFEKKVKKIDGKDGYIDLLWKGVLLIEQKSKGLNLNRAYKQASDYFQGLKDSELPKYILVTDFSKFRLYDLDEDKTNEFELKDLYKNIELFSFISGYQKRVYKESDPVNIEAASKMGELHDSLKDIGYDGHNLEVYLVRILFCLFADYTGIFEKATFREYIDIKTEDNGSDLAPHLSHLFQILDTPENERLKNLDEDLLKFPYVNGNLFQEVLPIASFDSNMKKLLLDCCSMDWGQISPDIFGAMFQSVMSSKERRYLGEHYTSEKNILKVIKPLFLDELYKEFEGLKNNKNKLKEFHSKISRLKFLDPACGCGNFLVVTYRELRLLEIEVLKSLYKNERQMILDIKEIIKVNIDSFYGIEYKEFPARIAEVAMWLVDHQMNIKISQEFGQYFARLPLDKSAKITNANALRFDWNELVPKDELSYILGNPPFIGKQLQNEEQKEDMNIIFNNNNKMGILDYVSCWYIKASEYIQNTKIRVAFVSTNSINQGEQIAVLWEELFNKYKIKIHFAHRTFKWKNESGKQANVYVIIIGFANFDIDNKLIYEYDTPTSEPHELKAKNINPYLIDREDNFIIKKRSISICNAPKISFGSMPNDNGYFLFTDEEKNEFLEKEANAEKYFKPILSAREFLNNKKRWCLWLIDINPDELKKLSEISKRVELVKQYRKKSKRKETNILAESSTLFGENRQPNKDYILIPRVSSENRKYIPMGFFSKDYIVSDTCLFVSSSSLYYFGILQSKMHMSWVNCVCGRLKGDFRYSVEIVYNNFPFPENPSEKQIKRVEEMAKIVLEIRKELENSSLATLYDPITIPSSLVKAHQKLDKAVDLCYRPQVFENEIKRIDFLSDLYDKYKSPLFDNIKSKRNKKAHSKKN